MEEKKISEQWPEFYNKLKKADRSNMVRFSTSIDLIDKYNEPLFQYLSDKKIPVVYISNEKMKNSAIFQKFGNIPNALMWCVFMKFKGVERINIFVNTDGNASFNIAKMALHSRQDLFSMLETILVHESIHAYLYSLNFHVNYDATGRAMSMLHLITEKSKITNNDYIKNRLAVINNSDPQEVVTYILTENVLSDFVKSIIIDGKNGWLAYCEFINYIDPFGILLKYSAKRQEIPGRVLADAEMKFRIYKHKGDTYERPVTVKEMKEGGIISTIESREFVAEKYAQKISEIAKELGKIDYYPSVSVTDFGTSIYVQNDVYKIRFSDHSVSNIFRMETELHYNLDDLYNDKILPFIKRDIEIVLFPEKFKRFQIKDEANNKIIVSPPVRISDLKNEENPFELEYYFEDLTTEFETPKVIEGDIIIGKRESVKGRMIYKVKRPYKKLFKRLVNKNTGEKCFRIEAHSKEYDNYKMAQGGIITDGTMGGIISGEPHSAGGVDAIIKETGQPIEVEGGEAIIKKKVVRSNKKYNLDGKLQTPRQILNKLNTDEGGNKI